MSDVLNEARQNLLDAAADPACDQGDLGRAVLLYEASVLTDAANRISHLQLPLAEPRTDRYEDGLRLAVEDVLGTASVMTVLVNTAGAIAEIQAVQAATAGPCVCPEVEDPAVPASRRRWCRSQACRRMLAGRAVLARQSGFAEPGWAGE